MLVLGRATIFGESLPKTRRRGTRRPRGRRGSAPRLRTALRTLVRREGAGRDRPGVDEVLAPGVLHDAHVAIEVHQLHLGCLLTARREGGLFQANYLPTLFHINVFKIYQD